MMFSPDRMVKEILPAWEKSKKHSVREFLYTLSRPTAPLGQVDDVCLALLDSYERARYGAQVSGVVELRVAERVDDNFHLQNHLQNSIILLLF